MESLLLRRLTLENFRNIKSAEFLPGTRFNVISGNNGSGKTNLLEAIYFFSALRSFRTTLRKELVCRETDVARIKGFFGGSAAGLDCEIEITDSTRKILKNEKELVDAAAHFQQLPMVLFHPANMILVQGGPKERRRFLDRALFQAEPSYPALSSDYNRALQSRNRLLKDRPKNIGILKPFDLQLAQLGHRITDARTRFLDAVRPVFVEAAFQIGKGISASLVYKPDVFGTVSDVEKVLEKSFARDKERGFTARGPHADDVEIEIRDLPAKRFASQGQQRMAVLSLKIAEARALSASCGKNPVLLLDDISSELDRERNRELFSYLQSSVGQVFITTTHLDHVLLDSDRQDFSISNGALMLGG